MKKYILLGTLVILFIVMISGCSSDESSSQDRSDCNIKGNISYNTGEKIYHLPEDQFYDVTEIDESKGEKWFCSEEEAEEAGFRRSER
jgi:micrococcal nuclease